MTSLIGITNRHPDIFSGTPVFVGTRVPVRSLFDYLEGGDNLEEFLHQFPSVKREQAVALLDAAYESVTEALLTERLTQLTTQLNEGQLAEVVDFVEFLRARHTQPQISEPTQKIDWALFRKHRGCYDGAKINRAELYDRGLR